MINYMFNNHVAVLIDGADIVEIRAEDKPELFQRVVNLCMTGKADEALAEASDAAGSKFIEEHIAEVTDGLLHYDETTDSVVFNSTDGRKLPILREFANRVREAWINDDEQSLKVYNNFMTKASNNPNDVSASDLFEFITVNKLPLAVDGDVLAYKIVRPDFMDLHSNTKDHTPGKVVTEEVVDYNRDVTCSNGLHFCSKDYLPQYGGFFGSGSKDNKLVLVKIDPAHVAAFPRDYNNAKGRCSQYTVATELPAAFFTAIVEMMEQMPYVDLAKLGVQGAIAERIGVRTPASDERDSYEQHEDQLDVELEFDEFDFEDDEDEDEDEPEAEVEVEVPYDVDAIIDRLRAQVQERNATMITNHTSIVSRTVMMDPDYRWYVALSADNQPRKFVAACGSRSEARHVRDQANQEIAKNSVNGNYMGLTNPVVTVYDSYA